MEIILLERVENLGQMGDVVNVKPGYARNYLLPQKKAIRATKQNREQFETQRVQLEAANLNRREEAQAVADKMAGLTLVFIRQAGESGQLYGSVIPRDITEELNGSGFTVQRTQVQLDQSIKILGLHKARVVLHPEVAVEIGLNVAQTEEEAARQASQGGSAAQLAAAAAQQAEISQPAPAKEAQADEGSAEPPADESTADGAETIPAEPGSS